MTITIYTASGTGMTATSDKGFAAQLAQGVDQTLYTWAPIDYPASGFDPADTISENDSITEGVTTTVAAIIATPGQFVLSGHSQGAQVMAKVLLQIQSGALTARQADFIGAVMFGNPVRQHGALFPGSPLRDGHGISETRLTTTPHIWWEMVTPNDIATNVPSDGAGDILGPIFDAAAQLKIVDIHQLYTNILQALIGQGAGSSAIRALLASPPAAGRDMVEAAQFLIDAGAGNKTSGHMAYDVAICWPGQTYVQVAIAYLNALATAAPLPVAGVEPPAAVEPLWQNALNTLSANITNGIEMLEKLIP